VDDSGALVGIELLSRLRDGSFAQKTSGYAG
jgi:hypothetical protein